MFDKVHPAFNASDKEMERQEELSLIYQQIRMVDGNEGGNYESWKSILNKVRAYNAEHE